MLQQVDLHGDSHPCHPARHHSLLLFHFHQSGPCARATQCYGDGDNVTAEQGHREVMPITLRCFTKCTLGVIHNSGKGFQMKRSPHTFTTARTPAPGEDRAAREVSGFHLVFFMQSSTKRSRTYQCNDCTKKKKNMDANPPPPPEHMSIS